MGTAFMQLASEKAHVAEYFKAGNLDLGMIRVESVSPRLLCILCHSMPCRHWMHQSARSCYF